MLDQAAKPAKFGTRLALVAGFGGVLALMAVAGIDSIRVLHEIEDRHIKITQAYLEQHHDLERIQSSLYLSGTVLRDYLLEPDPLAAKMHVAGLNSLRQQADEAARTYSSSLSPEESVLFSELRTELDAYWNTLAPALRWSAEERRARGYSFLRSEVSPRRTAMLRVADKIEAINEQALRADDRFSAQLFSSFRRRTVAMLALTLSLGLVLAAVIIAHILRLERDARLRYHEIVRARGELERLSARLVEAQEGERRTISRELHDEVGQSLSALLVDLGNLAAVTPRSSSPRAVQLLGTIRKLAENSLSAVRNMALLLRPSMLDDFGLIPALHWQAREVSRRTGIRVDVVADDVADELLEEHRTCVYRVVQEALHNCERHAQAASVRIVVTQEDGRLLLTVQDDGKGFDVRKTRGLGLIGMEERVRHLGGAFEVQSQPGRGTRLRIELPLARGVQVEQAPV